MHRIARDQFTYRFAADVKPVLEISPGDRVTAEMFDASTGRIRKSEDVFTYAKVRDPLKVNPAAGPIFVRGARAGGGLVVTIEDIQLTELGFVRVSPGAGLIQEGRTMAKAIMVRTEGDHLVFDEWLRLPIRPMVGVIGTAPATGVTYTGYPGPLGSNLDVNAVTVGSKVHLPVEVEGGLLALGDVHAVMSDGEVSGTGVEINAEVTFKVDLEEGPVWPRVWIETPTSWVTTAYGPDLVEVVRSAVADMVRMLQARLGLTAEESFMAFSAAGDARIGQCACIPGVDLTAYAMFPKVST